ncbi:hypothetical protein GAYE_SCF17G3715 [Galdieria yellowstonensis]|uniref:Uncharacterized protein n=1 Tax=Galdieria yellowstonensis TaxID=3028027 RepID=A0AAV9IF19_9RHOD|nr:hypothetical protein GAYE_SCF17G3715 [Galdieria yellowstonensis]
MKPRNVLIVDEHNALWQKFGNDPKTWLPFFEFYADPWYRKFVIAGSQLHEFKLPSGYETSIQYVEPLSREEFAIWENLSDYPLNLKDKTNEVIDLTGLVDRRLSSIEMSCWIKFIRNYALLDYAYVDMSDAQLERLFEKSAESVPLAVLLNAFFEESFEVSPVYNAEKSIVDFQVTDSQGTSCRERMSILYVTPLTRSEAQADSAPGHVEFLSFHNFADRMKPFIDVGQNV